MKEVGKYRFKLLQPHMEHKLMPKMERLYLFIYLRWNVFKWASKASRILIYGKERVFTSVVDPEEPIAPYWLAP